MNVDLKQYAFLDEHCLAMRGVTRDYQPDWDATRYFIGGKMFVMVGREKDVRPIISIKLDPNFGQILREQYDDIVPGYYLNKSTGSRCMSRGVCRLTCCVTCWIIRASWFSGR